MKPAIPWSRLDREGGSTRLAVTILEGMKYGHVEYTSINLCHLQSSLSFHPQRGDLPLKLASQGLILLNCTQSYCIHWMDKDWLFYLLEANIELLLNEQKPNGCWKLPGKLVRGVATITCFLLRYVAICRNDKAKAAAIRARNWLLRAETPDRLQFRQLYPELMHGRSF